ncbi:MAG: hypothetical protein KDF24_06415 [Rhodocyclaceae bacterium]|nr:hypothetical protein [Rhodocyclaceae bacterium]MCB1962785.1 hypothetical protein [Rhodocyclaceae bacterium]
MSARRIRCGALVALLAASSLAAAQRADTVTGDKATDMAVDLVVVRPVGFVGAVIGSVGFVLALPFTLPSGSVGETAHEWIGKPLEYTFDRPLGNFDQCGSDRHPCGNR